MTPIYGGWRVAETASHHIGVLAMLVNYRLVTTPKDDPSCYDRWWCYAGKSPADLLRTVAAAVAWAEEGGPEPLGWNKDGATGEWREPERRTG